MQVAEFRSIAVGETDYRALDITNDLAGETVVGLSWTCALLGGSNSVDPDPGARIVSSMIATSITEWRGPAHTPITFSGVFAVVNLSGFPVTAAGYWYQLTADVTTSGGRTLSYQGRIACTSG